MKQGKWFLIVGAAIMITGCTPEKELVETTTAAAEVTTAAETEMNSGAADDNFSADKAETEKFAGMIQEAVAQKDLGKLAELAAFPMYMGFPDGGKSIDSKEEFLALDPETVFTAELMDSVAEADEKNLSPSRAGFVLTKESGEPNVVFGLRDGVLAVTGINY